MHVGVYLSSYACTASISESALRIFLMMRHSCYTKKVLIYFPKNYPFCGMWEVSEQFAPKIMQPYIS